jgi:PPP family 3-phenylpropionic acid transporter
MSGFCAMSAASTTSRAVFRVNYFLRYTLIGSVFPLLSLWVEQVFVDKAKIGMMLGGIALVSLLTMQAWGYAADMLWPRRGIMLVNVPIAVLILFFSSWATFWPLFLMLQILQAIFIMPVDPILNSVVLGSREGRDHFAAIRAWGTIGFIVACLLGGLLADVFKTAWIAFPMVLAGGALWWLSLWLLDTPHLPPAQRPAFAKVQHFFLSQPHFAWFLGAVFLFQMIYAPLVILQVFLVRGLTGDTLTHTAAASLYIIGALAELPIFLFGDRILRRFGELPCVVVGAAAGIFRFGLVPFVGIRGLLALQCLHAFTFGLFYLAGITWMNRHTPDEYRSSAQTMYLFVTSLASFIGHPIGGKLFDLLGADHIAPLFLGGTAIIALSIVGFLRVARVRPISPVPAVLPLPRESASGV